MSRWFRAVPLALFAALATATPAAPAVLDQSQPTPMGGMWRSMLKTPGATFTAGLAGQLTQLEIGVARLGNPGDFRVTIYTTDQDGLPASELGSVVLASDAVPAFVDDHTFALFEVDVAALGITVTPGRRYAYGLSAAGADGVANDLRLAGTEGDAYAAGHYWVTGQSGVYIYPQHDGMFRTWVEGATGAEATTWATLKKLFR